MDNLPSKDCKSRRQRVAGRAENILRGVVLMLSKDAIRLGLSYQIASDFNVKVVDVLYGSLNLGAATIQRMWHGISAKGIRKTAKLSRLTPPGKSDYS